MTSFELYDLVVAKREEISPDIDFSNIQKAMLEECCEHVVAAEGVEDFNNDQMVLMAITSLNTSTSMMKAVIDGARPMADTVTINYRDRQFVYNSEGKQISHSDNRG